METVFFFSFPPRYQSQRKLFQTFKVVSLITCRYGDRHHRGQIEEAARYLVDLGIKGNEDEVSAERQELAQDELVRFVLDRLRVHIPHHNPPQKKQGRREDLHCARSSHPTKRQRLAKTTVLSGGNGTEDRNAQSGSATVERQMIPLLGLSPPRGRPNTMHDADPDGVQPMYSLTSNAASFGDPLLFSGINTFSDNFDYEPFQGINTFSGNFDYEPYQGINTFSGNFDYDSVIFPVQPSVSALPA